MLYSRGRDACTLLLGVVLAGTQERCYACVFQERWKVEAMLMVKVTRATIQAAMMAAAKFIAITSHGNRIVAAHVRTES